jgi:hypothetical protein
VTNFAKPGANGNLRPKPIVSFHTTFMRNLITVSLNQEAMLCDGINLKSVKAIRVVQHFAKVG